jgi:hypothetical protein
MRVVEVITIKCWIHKGCVSENLLFTDRDILYS